MALSHRLPFLPKVPKGFLRQLEFRERKNWLWSTLLSAFCSLDLNINWPCYWLSAMLLAGLSVSRHRDIFPFFFFFFIPRGSKLFSSSLMLYHPLPKEENVWKNNIKVLLMRFQHKTLNVLYIIIIIILLFTFDKRFTIHTTQLENSFSFIVLEIVVLKTHN